MTKDEALALALEALEATERAMGNKNFAAEVLAEDSVIRQMIRSTITYINQSKPAKPVNQVLVDALQDGLSVCRSVSISRDRKVVREGCVMYLQTEEWCKWLEDEVAPKLRTAISQAQQSDITKKVKPRKQIIYLTPSQEAMIAANEMDDPRVN